MGDVWSGLGRAFNGLIKKAAGTYGNVLQIASSLSGIKIGTANEIYQDASGDLIIINPTTAKQIKLNGKAYVVTYVDGTQKVTVGGEIEVLPSNYFAIKTGKDMRFYNSDNSIARKITFTNMAKSICILVKDSDTDVAVGDGKDFFVVPASMNGMNLLSAFASNYIAGTTGNHYIQIRRVRAGTPVNMLVGNGISIASGTISGTGTVDTANDDIATGDLIFIDTDAVHTTPAKGLSVIPEFGEVA